MAAIFAGPIVPSRARSQANGIVVGNHPVRARTGSRPLATQAAQDRRRTILVEIRGSVARIVDADTLEVAGQKMRLQGIDAP